MRDKVTIDGSMGEGGGRSSGGAFRTLAPTSHTVTNADVIGRFLDVAIRLEADGGVAYRCTVGAAVKEKVS